MSSTLRIGLLIYICLYILFALVMPYFRVRSGSGDNPVKIQNTDNVYDVIKLLLRSVLYLRVLIVVATINAPIVSSYLSPFPLLADRNELGFIGLGMLFAALALMAFGQFQMGTAWRIGVDPNLPGHLVTRGLFNLSRNPIYVGMRATALATFLVLPNALTLVLFVLGDILLQIQVRLEEEFLRSVHGDAYINYCKRVPRWFGFSAAEV